MSSRIRRKDATVIHANEAILIANTATDYEPIDAAIAYGIKSIEYKYEVNFSALLIRYIKKHVR